MIIIWALFGLVAIARAKHPAPFRTRSLSAEALMVLRLKAWESKSLPNLINPKISLCNGLLSFNLAISKQIKSVLLSELVT